MQVPTTDALRQLVQRGRLYRRESAGRYLYCAAERERRQQQWAARQAQQSSEDDRQTVKVLFYSLLDEQQRRLFAGLASLEWGHGGDQRMAQLFGLDVDIYLTSSHLKSRACLRGWSGARFSTETVSRFGPLTLRF